MDPFRRVKVLPFRLTKSSAGGKTPEQIRIPFEIKPHKAHILILLSTVKNFPAISLSNNTGIWGALERLSARTWRYIFDKHKVL